MPGGRLTLPSGTCFRWKRQTYASFWNLFPLEEADLRFLLELASVGRDFTPAGNSFPPETDAFSWNLVPLEETYAGWKFISAGDRRFLLEPSSVGRDLRRLEIYFRRKTRPTVGTLLEIYFRREARLATLELLIPLAKSGIRPVSTAV